MLKLAWKNIINKPLTLFLTLLLFALGSGLISFIFILNNQIQEKFENNLAGINMVLGAKGSPLQLILCNMYHIDSPTGNIRIKDAKPFLNPQHPFIKKAIPLSLGDSYQGHRIVGTIPNILTLYKAKLDNGKLWKNDFEVTIGANVSKKLEIKIGDTFYSSHGLVLAEGLEHDHGSPFKVIGILKQSNTVLDQLILTNTASLWKVHDHEGGTPPLHNDKEAYLDEESNHKHHNPKDQTNTIKGIISNVDKSITSILVTFKNPKNFQVLNMPRGINENTKIQAASPAIELNKMYAMMGSTEDILRIIAYVIIIVSAISIFIMLYNSLNERKYELAIMRIMGGTRRKLFSLITLEGVIIATLGASIGIMGSHFSFALASTLLEEQFQYQFAPFVFLKEEVYIFIAGICLGIFAAIIPAIQAAKTDISKTIAR